MTPYYARICWNTSGWTRPTGSAKDSPKTFFGRFGFGFEEWLFDPTAVIDGWQYGFLQPVNHGYKRWVGRALPLQLYSIPGGGFSRYREEFYLPTCEVLTPAQASRIVRVFTQSGRLARMQSEVREVAGDPSPLSKHSEFCENIINVRFPAALVRKTPAVQPKVRADYYHLYAVPGGQEEIVSPAFPDETSDSAGAFEGATKSVTVNVYERDPRARKACLRRWGFSCAVCGMNFLKVYGAIGTEYIHVHHLVPLSKIRRTYKVDGARDLRPVCPNCHAMLHKGPNPPTIEHLRQCMADASAQNAAD